MNIWGILIAVAVSAILGFAAVGSFDAQTDNAKVTNSRVFFTDGLNQAVAMCYSSELSLANCDKSELVRIGGIKSAHQTTPWGDNWTVTAATSTTTIVFPLDKSSDADIIGPKLVSALNQSAAPVTPSYDAATDDLTVIYTY